MCGNRIPTPVFTGATSPMPKCTIPSVPDTDTTPPRNCESTALYLAALCPNMFLSTKDRCAAPNKCKIKSQEMVYCSAYLCHDFVHLECVEITKAVTKAPAGPYQCYRCRMWARNLATNEGIRRSNRLTIG